MPLPLFPIISPEPRLPPDAMVNVLPLPTHTAAGLDVKLVESVLDPPLAMEPVSEVRREAHVPIAAAAEIAGGDSPVYSLPGEIELKRPGRNYCARGVDLHGVVHAAARTGNRLG